MKSMKRAAQRKAREKHRKSRIKQRAGNLDVVDMCMEQRSWIEDMQIRNRRLLWVVACLAIGQLLLGVAIVWVAS
jgi:hypothetical protein